MRRARGAGARNALGVVLIVVAALVLGGLGAASFLLRAPPTDAETLCRTDAPIGAHTIILVDSTDRLEARHRRKLSAVLAQERARLGQYDRLTIMRINVRRRRSRPSCSRNACRARPSKPIHCSKTRGSPSNVGTRISPTRLSAPYAAQAPLAPRAPRQSSPVCARSRLIRISAQRSRAAASC